MHMCNTFLETDPHTNNNNNNNNNKQTTCMEDGARRLLLGASMVLACACSWSCCCCCSKAWIWFCCCWMMALAEGRSNPSSPSSSAGGPVSISSTAFRDGAGAVEEGVASKDNTMSDYMIILYAAHLHICLPNIHSHSTLPCHNNY